MLSWKPKLWIYIEAFQWNLVDQRKHKNKNIDKNVRWSFFYEKVNKYQK